MMSERKLEGENAATKHRQDHHWTLDRRISIGHLWTIGAALVMSLTWAVGLQFQLNAINKAHVQDQEMLRAAIVEMKSEHLRDTARLERLDGAQYAEIIRRLELLQMQLNAFVSENGRM